MRTLLTLLTLLFITYEHTFAGDPFRQSDTRSIGLGNNEVTQSPQFNPSLLSLYEKRNIAVHYYNTYHIKELSTLSAFCMFPNDMLSFGLHLSTFGYDEYRQTMIRIPVSKQVHESWILGAAVQYSYLQTILFEDKSGFLSADLGISWIPVENLLVGMLIMDFPNFNFNKKDTVVKDFMAYKIQVGFEWLVLNNLLIISSLDYTAHSSVKGKLGVEYFLTDKFRVRTGITTSPLTPSFGIGYLLGTFTLDMAITYHSILGMSSGLGISYSF